MEIKGEEFLKNVQLKQEKNEIRQRLQELENEEKSIEEENEIPQREESIDFKLKEENELSDLLLSSSNQEIDKKKYIMLGLALVVLFLVTIVIIRVVSNSDEQKDTLLENKPEEIKQDKLADSDSIEQKYQQIINEKIKMINQEKKEEEKVNSQLDIKKVEELEKKEEIKAEQPVVSKPEIKEEPKADIFEMKKPEPTVQKTPIKPEPKKEIAKVEKPKVSNWPAKKSALKEPEVKDFAKKQPDVVQGTFVQIGAFSKEPNKKYLDKITKLGFEYKIYKVEVKGRMFNKLLIGPYSSKDSANKELNKIRTSLDAPKAFIVKL